MIIRISDFSFEDLAGIKKYIKKDSEYYANVFIEKIFDSIAKLKQFSKMGRIVPEYNRENIREIFVKSYRIIYRIDPDKIFILTVIHGARDLKRIKKLPDNIK